MRASLRRLAQVGHVHKPSIHFLGKRTQPTESHHPAPHPLAPPDIRDHFSQFLEKLSKPYEPQVHPSAPQDVRDGFARFVDKFNNSSDQSSSSGGGGGGGGGEAYQFFWEAPKRFWTKGREIDEAQIEAIMSGGASKW